MKIYLVGGAVRDKLLGLPVKEKDYVVVGATPNDMLKQGYRQVGKEFPVFLHPKTSEEYALARMERKVEAGYKGFSFDTSPDVSLKEDLLRRDLTINAMAEDQEGKLYDFYNGKQDLEQKILRHVSPAFAEDPVRILRLGRFLARYYYLGFKIAEETNGLMREMVKAGEVDALVAERVWKELDRALLEKNPEKFFEVLANCGALAKLFPGIELDGPGLKALNAAAEFSDDAAVRFAALMSAQELKQAMQICDRYRAPNEYRELVQLTIKLYSLASHAKKLSAEELLDLFGKLDIFRREGRFLKFLQAGKARANDFPLEYLQQCAQAAKSFNVHDLLSKGVKGEELARQLRTKRIEKIEEFIKK